MKRVLERLDVRGAVVVGVDATPAARQAVTWAGHQAALEGRRVVLVRTTGSLGTAGTTWLDQRDPSTSAVLEAMDDEGASVLAEATEELRHAHPGLEVETVVVADDPVAELRRVTEHAHLVVVGSDGHGLAPHGTPWQAGPRIVRHSACPVVVVPRHARNVLRHGVLVGDDLTERAAPVLRFAYECAAVRNLPLTVLHAARESTPDRVADVERALAESVSGLAEEFPDVETRLEVTYGWATGRLLQTASQMHLLVIGQHHRPGPYESPLGHVRAGMVARATCPVAVVPVAAHARALVS